MNVIYKGVLHEYREVPDGCSRGTVSGLLIKECHDSARSRNPQKFQHDAAVLKKVLETEIDPFLISRYKFYLAQSYKDLAITKKHSRRIWSVPSSGSGMRRSSSASTTPRR
jgi:hypothetical protein